MMPLWKSLACGVLATLSVAQIPLTGAFPLRPRAEATNITAAQLISINANMSSCASAPAIAPGECRTAEQAAPWVNAAFDKYQITSAGEKAAILSLQLFETGYFVYEKNHFPGRPGQGTRSMMMFNFIYQYAVATPSTSAQAKALVPDPNNTTDDKKNEVLALVLGDELSFASAQWFYKTNCKYEEVAPGLQAESVSGWDNYITKCVGTTVTEERKSLWDKTLKAIKA